MDKFLTIVEKAKRRSSTPSSDVEVPCECSSADSDGSNTQQEAPKRKKGISKVWKYFKRSDDKKLAKCLNCGKEYKTSGNTSNLRDHLKRFHPGIDGAVAEPADDSNLPASSSSSTRSSMHSISSYFKRAIIYDSNSKRKRDIDRALAKLIAKDVQPFNIVENEGFIEYSQILDPRYKIPSKTHLRDVLVKGIYDEAVLTLKTKLKETTSIAVTCDCWTSSANDSFLTVTCHFIDCFQFRTASLSTEKLKDETNHSAENIADTLKGVLEQFNVLDKTVCIVTDNASSMLKACEILKIRNLPCFAHTLNLVVQDGLKIENKNLILANLFSKCKTTVTYFKKSCIAYAKFRKAQETEKPLSLLQETPTRWNSFYFMIQRIIQTNKAISKVLLATANAPLPFTANEIIILEDICNLLALFQNATDQISGGKYITISLIIPIVYGLYRKVEQLTPSLKTTEGKMLQDCLLDSITKRLFKYEERSIPRIGTILDPRFKKIGFRNEYNAEQASALLENELVIASQQIVKPIVDLEPTTSKEKETFFDFVEIKANEKITTSRSDAIIVKRQYLERGVASQDTDPLIWIQMNETDLELLKSVMLKYLCVPGTSVESERMFSKAGEIVSDRRTRLKEENINMLMFLNKNTWLYEKTN